MSDLLLIGPAGHADYGYVRYAAPAYWPCPRPLGRHGAGTGNVDVIVAAQGLDKPGAADDLGVQSLKRNEHDAKVGRCRHTQVLFADVLGLALDHGVERLARSRHGL